MKKYEFSYEKFENGIGGCIALILMGAFITTIALLGVWL